MACEVEFTDEFNVWWESLNEGEQDDIAAIVEYSKSTAPDCGGLILELLRVPSTKT